MKSKYLLYISETERKVVIDSLLGWKTDLQEQKRYTDAIDDLLLKLLSAPLKNIKIN